MSAMMPCSQPLAGVPKYLVVFPKATDAWPEVQRITGAVRSASRRIKTSSAEVLPARREGEAQVFIYDRIGVAALDLSEQERYRLEERGAVVVENALIQLPPEIEGDQSMAFADDGTSALDLQSTWGVSAIGADRSQFSGQGVRVAVVDTGIDLAHPDFGGRIVAHRSFVPSAPTVQDGNGHGTHVAGTIGGRCRPGMPRYSVSPECELVVAKALADDGMGYSQWIVDGINWAAIDQGAAIINLSLGSTRSIGEPFSAFYEDVAARLLEVGVLLIAAAGNDSRRPHSVAAIGNPAACPSMDATAAVDRALNVARFSNAGDTVAQPAYSAPGVDIYSAWNFAGYRTISGTSMAAPHASGVAAQLAQATGLRGTPLRDALRAQSALSPLGPHADYGVGFVNCP